MCRLQVGMARQALQVGTSGLAGDCIVNDRDVNDQCGEMNARRWAGMNFVVQYSTQGIIRWQAGQTAADAVPEWIHMGVRYCHGVGRQPESLKGC